MIKRASGGVVILGLLVLSAWATDPVLAEGRRYTAKLGPNLSVLPKDSKARGTATFLLDADGKRLHYQVDVFDLDPVSQIHIHLGKSATTSEGEHYHLPPDKAYGPLSVYLLNYTRDGVKVNGTVAQGTITTADLTGSLRGQPLQVLLDHMNSGWSYVNVHIFRDFGQGNRYCCPGGVRGAIWPDE